MKERRAQYGLNLAMARVQRKSDVSFGAVLGEGTFGKVQVVSVKRDNRDLVAKIPKDVNSARLSTKEFNFLRELSSGNNPFIVTLRYFFREYIFGLNPWDDDFAKATIMILGKCPLLVSRGFC